MNTLITEQQIADVLEECLSAIDRGHKTPEACLEMYPTYRRELRDAFWAVGLLQSAPKVKPSPVFRDTTKIRVTNRAAAMYAAKSAPPAEQTPATDGLRRMIAARRNSWVWAGVLGLLLLMIVLGSGTVSFAASSSVPGDALYGLKVFFNDIQLSRTDPRRQAELHIQLANQNLADMQYLATANRYDDFGVAALSFQQRVLQAVQAIAALQTTDPQAAAALARQLDLTLANYTSVLTLLLSYAPTSARPAIENALLVAARTDPSQGAGPAGPTVVGTITICHDPGPLEYTLVLSPGAVLAHENHGDLLGPCGGRPALADRPTGAPTAGATARPAANPTSLPTAPPTAIPSATRTATPTQVPSRTPLPTVTPTQETAPPEPEPTQVAVVTVCHQTGEGEVTMTISAEDLNDHLAHGDYLGECIDLPSASSGPVAPGGGDGGGDPPAPAPSETPEPTETAVPTDTVEPTQTPDPTHTADPTQTPEPTDMVDPTPTVDPTQTPNPTQTTKPIFVPVPSNTPAPTSTP